MENTVKIFIKLLDEGGTEVFRPTQAIQLNDNRFRILPCEDYDPEDEIWEFLPGTIVSGEWVESVKGGQFLMAVSVE